MEFYANSARRALGVRDNFRNSPRFGYTNEFSDIFDEDEAPGYVIGIMITALILVSCFLCWGIFLMILKCMGKQRVGFLSGAPYEANVNDEPSKRPMRGRIAFGVSGLLYFVFTMTLIFAGYGNLEQTTDDMGEGVRLGQNLFTDAGSLLQNFLEFAKEAAVLRDEVVEVLEDVFEIVGSKINETSFENITRPDFQLPPNASLPVGDGEVAEQVAAAVTDAKFIFENVNLQQEATKVVDFLLGLDKFIAEPTRELQEVVTEGEQVCNDVSDGLTDVELRRLQIGFGVPFSLVSLAMLLLMGATAMGMGKNNTTKDCCTSWFVMPIFIFLLLFMVVMTMGFSIGGIVNADFCSGGSSLSPDETLLEILDKKGIPPETLKYQLVSYVISGCDFESPQSENPMVAYENFDQELETITSEIKSFTERIEAIDPEDIARRLARDVGEIRSMKEKAANLETRTLQLFNTMEEVLTDLACARIYEIYEQVVHQATCESSYSGLAWCFTSFLMISFSGFVMVTFRSVLYPVAGVDDDDYSWNKVKEEEAQKGAAPVNGDDDEGEFKGYTVNTGMDDNTPKEGVTEPPMGGSASARFEAVGDENPFKDDN